MSESTITCSCCGAAVPPDDIVYSNLHVWQALHILL